jgi:alpha-1,2-mannosyltransferase
VAFAVVAWLAGRQAGLAQRHLLLVAAVALSLEPVLRNTVLGQVNLVLAALIMVDIFLLPDRYRGVLIGLVAGIKLTPAIFALYFLVKRDWASFFRAVAAGVVTVIVGWVAAPASSVDYWLGGLDKVSRFGDIVLTPANQSLRGVIVRMMGTPDPPQVVVMAAAGVAVLLALLAARRQVQAGRDLAAVLALATGALLASPVSWTHHWVWVLPALVLLASMQNWFAVGLTVVVFYIAPMWVLSTGGGAELRYGWGEVLVGATYVLMGLAFLAWLLWSDRQPARRGGAARRSDADV